MCKTIDEPKARPDVGCTGLLACPCCGYRAWWSPRGAFWYVRCTGCGLGTLDHPSKADAISAWNHRVANASLSIPGDCSEISTVDDLVAAIHATEGNQAMVSGAFGPSGFVGNLVSPNAPADLPAVACKVRRDVGLFQDWIADKEAEYRMSGLGKKEAKEKALSDWYLYEEPNAPLSGNGKLKGDS